MTREQKILECVKRDGVGIEIGPSFRPIAPKSAGFRVHTLDHLSRAELIEKYRTHNVDVDRIEEVDFIWHGESFAELTGKRKHYDWIIASHVIEHTPDLIGFLIDCDSILADDGILSLAVPDGRYCFDHFRPVTGIAKVIDAHFERRTIHSAGTAAEYYLNVVSNRGAIAWGQESESDVYEFVHTPEDARNAMRRISEDRAYVDLHAWCFTPHSFRLLIYDLFILGLVPFRELAFHPSVGCEFHVTLSRRGHPPPLTRMQLRENAWLEIAGSNPTIIGKLEEDLAWVKRRASDAHRAIDQWNRKSWIRRAFHKLRLIDPVVEHSTQD